MTSKAATRVCGGRAIFTRYMGPTNTRGGRISATDGERSVTIPYPFEEDSDMGGAHDHSKAFRAWIAKYGTSRTDGTTWHAASRADGTGYVFVQASGFNAVNL